MTTVPTIKISVDKQSLVKELVGLEGVVAEYDRFLQGAEGEDEWETEALTLIKAQQNFLFNAKISLKAIDLVSAVLRKLLGRIDFSRVSLRIANSQEVDTAISRQAPSGQEVTLENFETLVAQVNSVAGNAPLALQEKIRFLLLSSLTLFRAVVKEDKEATEEAMTQINLLTSSRESQNLVREIALIAKEIYETLNALSEGIPIVDTLTESSDGISEAASKLKAVVNKLEEAAFGNLDFLEKLSAQTREDERLCVRVMSGVNKSRELLSELKKAHPQTAEALSHIDAQLGDGVRAGVQVLQAKIKENVNSYMSLTANQSFQDLTGQTLKKTIDFIENLEVQLLEILRKYKPVFDAASSEAPAPVTEPAKKEPSPLKQSQEDVDDLLSVLGF